MNGAAAGASMGPRPLVLVLDYPGRRDEAAIADLHLEEYGFDLCYLLNGQRPIDTPGNRYARRLLKSNIPTAPAIAVLGYCAAAHIGQQVAAELTRAGTSPAAVVAINASVVSPTTVVDACVAAAIQLDGTANDLPDVVVSLARRNSVPVDHAEAIIAGMHDLLSGLANTALQKGNHGDADPEIVRLLVDRHLEWIAHLLAAATIDAQKWGGSALHVVSHDHPVQSKWTGSTDTDMVALDISSTDLTRSKECASLVAEWLMHTLSMSTPGRVRSTDPAL